MFANKSDNEKFKLDIYQTYRNYVEHEDGLINNRMTWMLTIHGFLYASYAICLQKRFEFATKLDESYGLYHYNYSLRTVFQLDMFMSVLILVGMSISVMAFTSLAAAGIAIHNLRKDCERSLEILNGTPTGSSGSFFGYYWLPHITGGGLPNATAFGFFSQRYIPIIIFGGWAISLISLISAICANELNEYFSSWSPLYLIFAVPIGFASFLIFVLIRSWKNLVAVEQDQNADLEKSSG